MATRVPSRCIIAPSGEMAASPGSRARCSWTCASSRSCRHRTWALRSRPTSKSRSTSRWAAYEAGKRRACGDGALLDRCGRLPLDDPPWVHPVRGVPHRSLGRHAAHEIWPGAERVAAQRSEEHTSELQSLAYLVCRLLLEKKKKIENTIA